MAEKKNDKENFARDANMHEIKPLRWTKVGWIIAAFIVVLGFWGFFRTQKMVTTCPYEMDAVFALRALGNVEQAYRDFSENHNYATLEGLKMTGFVNFGYPDTSIAAGYRVVITPITLDNDEHSFTARIFPISRTRPCRIFQIGPDRVLKEFLPLVDSNPHRKENWIDASYLENQLPPRKHLEWMGENYLYD